MADGEDGDGAVTDGEADGTGDAAGGPGRGGTAESDEENPDPDTDEGSAAESGTSGERAAPNADGQTSWSDY